MDIIKFISAPRFNGKSITYSALVRHYYDSGMKISYETNSLDFGGEGFIFANEFLAVMNKTFGTTYEFSESYKDEVGKKHGNIDMHRSFAIRGGLSEGEILHYYDYDNIKNCGATYGEFTKEVLIAFADAVADYNKNGIKPKETDFHPNYKIEGGQEEINKEYNDNTSAIDAEVRKATDALAVTLSGDALTNAVNAVKEGYRWPYTRCREEKWDAERNLHLDEMANVAESAKSHIKRYKDYFDCEVFNTKREHYYSSDDRYHSIVMLRYGEKNGESFFDITPNDYTGELVFSFVGNISISRWRKEPFEVSFNLHGLTIEEVEVINHEFNQIWHDAKFKNIFAFAE